MTATLPPRYGLRECRLYRFYVTHPLTGETVLGYVGETGRQPFERLLEHLATKPWFDTVVRWEIDPQVFWGKDAVLAAETAAIRAERPFYNVKGNESNWDRIIPPDAIRQRRARDAQRGAERWVHPDDRPGAAPRPPRQPVVVRRPWRPWQKQLLGWGVAWALTTLAGWITLVCNADFAVWWQPAAYGAAMLPGGLLMLWLLLVWVTKPRTRKRLYRRLGWRR